LSLVAGGAVFERSGPAQRFSPACAGELARAARWRELSAHPLQSDSIATLSEVFAGHPRDGGCIGFVLGQVDTTRPLLWVQERMAILESGRVHPPGLHASNLIHVEARDARDTLWAMEEGLKCSALAAVIGEIWGDPKALDFTATRRLAVASERSGVPAFLVRLGGHASLSGARMRWRIESAPSAVNDLDPRAPGTATWNAELFRARGMPPGKWIVDEAGPFDLAASSRDRAVGEIKRPLALAAGQRVRSAA
jgi:protein ImuA